MSDNKVIIDWDDLHRKSSLVDNDGFDLNCEQADYLNAKTRKALERIHKKKDDETSRDDDEIDR